MSMAGVDAPSLREIVSKESAPRSFYDRDAALRFTDLARGTSFGGGLRELAGRSALLATESQLTSALALIELEGVARRIVILPPDADPANLAAIISIAGIDAAVVDEGTRRTRRLIVSRASYANQRSSLWRTIRRRAFTLNGS